MQTRTRAAYAIVSVLHLCATILTCDAAGRFDQSINTGQPRELINQPACWVIESFDDRNLCEIAGRIRPHF
ncbi:MAG: hypothetical protein QOG10_6887 [Kribbellaceae bacterium]|jgi:hypothetical protein|nr:hypothetical protein [Kribbellaceae bacterium]